MVGSLGDFGGWSWWLLVWNRDLEQKMEQVGNNMRKASNARLRVGLLGLALSWAAGCGGPSRVEAPSFDSKGAAAEAMSLYDGNTDGVLDEEELKQCPAFARAMDEMDSDQDGTLSEQEIKERIDFFVQSRAGRVQLACTVTKGGRPIPGCKVTFDPEPFVADMITPATGTTNEVGMAVINIDDQMGGMEPGFYKVRISRLGGSGKETLSKKYNEETLLGQEITLGSDFLATGLVFKLR